MHEIYQWRRFGIFIANFEQILHSSNCFHVEFEHAFRDC